MSAIRPRFSRRDISARPTHRRWALGAQRRCLLFLASSLMLLTACVDKVLGGRDANGTGTDARVLWTLEGYSNSGLPAVDEERAYFLGPDHRVIAVNKVAGTIAWSATLPSSRAFAFSGIVVGANALFVGDETIYALSKQTGELLWSFVPSKGRLAGMVIPAVDGPTILAGSGSGHLYAIDGTTGRELWVANVTSHEGTTVYDPKVHHGVVFAAFSDFLSASNGEPLGGVVAIDMNSGQTLWQIGLPTNVDPKTPTAAIGVTIAGDVVVTASRDGPVYAYHVTTGALAWKSPAVPVAGALDDVDIRDIRPTTSAAGLVIVGSTNQTVQGLRPSDGTRIWSFRSDWGSITARIWSDGTDVFVMHPGGQLEVLDGATGKLKWSVVRGGYYFLTGVAYDADAIYGGGIGQLIALRR